MYLKNALNGFILARIADGVSPSTINIYKLGLYRFTEFLKNPDVDAISQDHIRSYFHFLQTSSQLSQESLKMVLRTIQAFYTWAEVEINIKRPDRVTKLASSTSKEILPFSQDEIKSLIKACENISLSKSMIRKAFRMYRPTAKRDKAIILTLLDTGLRASELCRLRIKDVDLETGMVKVVPYLSGRKSKSRVVFIGKSSRAALWHYLAERKNTLPDDSLFIGKNNHPLDRLILGNLLRRFGNRAGSDNVHPHRFRHTFAIQYLRNGGDIFTLQRLLGHSDISMVRRYLNIADTDAQIAHQRASPVDRWNF
jgi:integrase/recombinase XerD